MWWRIADIALGVVDRIIAHVAVKQENDRLKVELEIAEARLRRALVEANAQATIDAMRAAARVRRGS